VLIPANFLIIKKVVWVRKYIAQFKSQEMFFVHGHLLLRPIAE